MLFAVVARARVPIVGLSMLLLAFPSILPPGIVAPPYHLNLTSDYFYQNRNGTYYPYRGGNSGLGVGCGAFFVYAYYVFSRVYWAFGAALSFKPAV